MDRKSKEKKSITVITPNKRFGTDDPINQKIHTKSKSPYEKSKSCDKRKSNSRNKSDLIKRRNSVKSQLHRNSDNKSISYL